MKRLIIAILLCIAQTTYAREQSITVSGQVKEQKTKLAVPYAAVRLKTDRDSTFIMGTVTDDEGRFSLTELQPGSYFLEIESAGFEPARVSLTAGHLNAFLDMGTILLAGNGQVLKEIVVAGKADEVSAKMDKKTFDLSANLTQTGASALDAMKNLPGISVQDGKVQLRGNDKVMVLIDGKQTALSGMGGQSGLDNIPASAIGKIEIIDNPSAKFDANGNAGIINIIYKKEQQEGFNGKAGFTGGLGALWVKQESYPGIRPQYTATPKLNPSVSLNYRKKKVNVFVQADNLYTKTLNKNEFTDRFYDNGDTVRQQTVRNRTTNVITGKTGVDWYAGERNTVNFSALFSSEKILDRGDEPFFNGDLSQRQRLWRFLEDELKTTLTLASGWQHKFKQAGRMLSAGFNYTYHRENEQYFFTNIMPAFTGLDSFKLISDEHVADLAVDYVQPLRYGRVEGGLKLRRRYIPVNMLFIPGLNSPLDTNAGGWANYGETIPAVYGNYILENRNFEVEAGLRVEYVSVRYDVNPEHNTYKSDGYHYTQPFPNLRLSYKLDDRNRFSAFYNRRVDRPNEVDIRIFPKYDDAELIKVGNPALRPQFSNTIELGYKTSRAKAYLYASVYHKMMDATITRISSTVGGNPLIYTIFQNAGRSYTSGVEMLLSQQAGKWAVFNLNLNAYQNIIEAFSVENLYPLRNVFSAPRQEMFSGNIKLNGLFHLPHQWDAQCTAIYQAPDLIPQGKTNARFSIDLGLRKPVLKGKGELFANATDIANTLRIKRMIQGDGFHYTSTNYYETQVVRAGFTLKF